MPASGVRPAWRGKYMAFTQQGTTLHGDGIHPTCLNYLKRLGVKYVQLMPILIWQRGRGKTFAAAI